MTRLLYLTCLIWVTFLASSATGQLVRQTNTTLRMPTELPTPSFSYRLNDAFNGMTFDKPIAITSLPGETNRVLIIERTGKIIIVNLATLSRTVFLDITPASGGKVYSDWDIGFSEGLTSIAFHPDFTNNGCFYVTYTLRGTSTQGTGNHNRLSRFKVSSTNPDFAPASSEQILLNQFDTGDGHNMNDLAFGPDGYLYLSTGDEGDGGTGDDYNNAQKINQDFFSGILRLDVDKKPGNRLPNPHPARVGTNYFVPADNPWVGATSFNGLAVNPAQVRTEFYAVGLRNPWRIHFDKPTGNLYAADIGQHGREEINIIVKGGNYGWSYREGTITGPKAPPPTVGPLRSAIFEYNHGEGPDEGRSLIGGVVYRGNRIPALQGHYIFGDWWSGNIWKVRYTGTGVDSYQRLASRTGITSIGTDPSNGDVLIADHGSGKILRLDFVTEETGTALPPTLAQTGAFSDLASLTPHAGIVPYEINAPFWSDNATKRRWFSIPNPALNMTFNPQGNWSFPTGTVWIKHFDLETTVGDPSTKRRLETRLLVKNTDGVYGVTYRWNGNTNAVLVPAEGMEETIPVNDGGSIRQQVWKYPARDDCLKCHTPAGGHAAGFNTQQLNRDVAHGSVTTNQLVALRNAGYFTNAIGDLHALRTLVHHTNSAVSREYRVRSYLDANCMQCHQPAGGARAMWDARITTPLSAANILNGSLFNLGDSTNNRVVVAGNADRSMLLKRIATLGAEHMPPLGTTVIDAAATNLMRAWIVQDLTNYQSLATWQQTYFGTSTSTNAAANADPDRDGASNYLEFLTGTNPQDPSSAWKIGFKKTPQATIAFPRKANVGYEVQFTTNFVAPWQWQRLNVPSNQPWFSAQEEQTLIVDPAGTNGQRFYRVRVFEP